MGVRIEFYGLCLFIWEEDRVRVLLPNATRLDRTHPDGTKPGKVHFPFFIHRDDTGAQFVLPLSGHRVTSTVPEGKPDRLPLGELINLGVLKSGMKLRSDAHAGTPDLLAAEIMLTGGRIGVGQRAPTGNYAFLPGSTHTSRNPACQIAWETKDTKVDFTITTPAASSPDSYKVPVDSTVGANRRIVIGNVCEADIMHWTCESVFCPPGTTVTDDDFKWLYHPFDLTTPTPLPIPTVECGSIGGLSGGAAGFAAMGASVSTCFPGEWCPPFGPCE